MNQTYTCQYNGHEGEPIMGICLDQQCNQKAQYCNECLVSLHSSHQKNCKSMIKIKQIIKNFQTQINDWFKQIEDEFKRMQKLYQQTTKLLTKEKNRMIDIEKYLQNEEFQQITKNIDILKRIYLIQESKQDTDNNMKLTDVLVKINDQLQSLYYEENDQEPVKQSFFQSQQIQEILSKTRDKTNDQQSEIQIQKVSKPSINQKETILQRQKNNYHVQSDDDQSDNDTPNFGKRGGKKIPVPRSLAKMNTQFKLCNNCHIQSQNKLKEKLKKQKYGKVR